MSDMTLNDINSRLVALPAEIASKKIYFEKVKSKLDYVSAKILLELDRKEFSNADLRKAAVEADERIYKLKNILIEAEAKYYEDVNFFQGVQERARNVRAEMRSLGDGI